MGQNITFYVRIKMLRPNYKKPVHSEHLSELKCVNCAMFCETVSIRVKYTGFSEAFSYSKTQNINQCLSEVIPSCNRFHTINVAV